MKSTAVFSAGLLAGAAFAQQSGPACNGISYDFSNFGGTLNYKTVTSYNWNMAQCKMQDTTAKSPIAPLDQGLTAVFRGPLKLKQFAVYNEAPASKKRDAKSSPRERRHHNHKRFHKKHAEPAQDELEKRDCGDTVTAVMDGKTVTWANKYGCDAAATPAPAATSQVPAANAPAVSVHADVAVASSKASSAPAAASSSSAPSTGSSTSNSGSKGGAWNRVAYYSASSGTASNLTFLYPVPFEATGFLPANGDTTGKPADTPQTLGDVLIPDNSRFYINSGNKMANNPNPAGKSYHGFSGNKIMLVEMTMPKSGSSQGQYPDMPALWLLNEELPATSDGAECNCWASGCGEWDIHEVLTKGADIGYSTMHMGSQYCGGADNGFKRVTSGTQKLAIIIKAGSTGKDSVARIIQLDNSYNFSDGISESDYQKWVSTPTAGGERGSVNAPCTAQKPSFKA